MRMQSPFIERHNYKMSRFLKEKTQWHEVTMDDNSTIEVRALNPADAVLVVLYALMLETHTATEPVYVIRLDGQQ